MEYVVEVGDVPVLLSAADGRRGAALERALGQRPASQASPDVVVRYLVDGPDLPGRAPDVHGSQLQLWFEGTELWAVELSGLSARVSGSEVWLGGPSIDLAGGLDRLFLSLLTHALFPHRHFVLHAGAIDLGGLGVLLLGASGMGKSTLAFAGARTGWNVLHDDMVMLRSRGPETFEVAGLSARPVAVPNELLGVQDRSGALSLGDARRRSVLQGLSPQAGWSTVAASLLVAHSEAPEGSLTKVDSSAALTALLRSCAGVINPYQLPEIFAAAHVLAQRPSFQLAQGRDAQARLKGTQNCLGELESWMALTD